MRNYASLYTLLLADLGLQRDDVTAPVCSDMSVQEVAKLALANSFYKKLAPNGSNRQADKAALEKFIGINESCGEFQGFIATSLVESYFYDYYKHNLALCLQPPSGRTFDMEYIRNHMATGPGAAQKADSRSMMTKLFESQLSYCNPDLVGYYRSALSEHGMWASAEMHRSQSYGFERVRGGKLFFAPKNAEISRTCCTEASIEMLIQKAIGAFLEESAYELFGIKLDTQPDFNRRLACIGSIDGSLGTADLVSASDSIAFLPLMRDLPNCFLKGMLRMARSEFAVLPDGKEVKLHMISTMGNGFTFPLQTVIFASAVRAVYDVMGLPCVRPDADFGVFGDDIIVRTEAFEFLVRMLTKLGYQVNVRKSFNTGPFRESCGHDYYSGHYVRGVFVRSLETPQEVYSAINRLLRWSAKHGVQLLQTISVLRSWARDIRVPPSEADDAGVHVPFKLSKARPVSDRYWFKYRACKRVVRKMEIAEPDAEGVVNPFGLGVGFLAGVIRRRDPSPRDNPYAPDESSIWTDLPVRLALRDQVGVKARYKIRTIELPFWDFWPSTKKAEMSGFELNSGAALAGGSQYSWDAVLVDHIQGLDVNR